MFYIPLKIGRKAHTSAPSARDLPLQRKAAAAQQLVAPTFYMYKWGMFEHASKLCYNHDLKASGEHTWVQSQCLKTYLSMKSKRLINCFWTLISSVWCQLSSWHHFQVAMSLYLVPHPNRVCTQPFRGEEQIPALRSAQGCKGYAAPNVKENSNSMLNNWFDVYVSHRLFSVGHHPPVVHLFPRSALKWAHLWCPADMNIPTFVKHITLVPLVF